MQKLGILLDSPGKTQEFQSLSTELNKLSCSDIDIIVFYAEYGIIPTQTNFALMQMVYAFDYDGILISTNHYTTSIMKNVLRCKKKFFYVWNLEWIYKPLNFSQIESLYTSPDINLLARSKSHADVLERTWQKPVAIIEDFNHEQIKKIIES
tara:strand:+ start:15285 stop:15740 length:456 start_codon:yes stop_codon:yes gene_type:complete